MQWWNKSVVFYIYSVTAYMTSSAQQIKHLRFVLQCAGQQLPDTVSLLVPGGLTLRELYAFNAHIQLFIVMFQH